MRYISCLLLVMASALAQAGLPEMVPVGNPGNKADSTNFGAVPYSYRIGKYEVTNAQYCEFLNAVAKADRYGLYNPGMAGRYGGIRRSGGHGNYTYELKEGMGDKPVNFVSWYDTLRYANWLTNGRGEGSTEEGCYTLTHKAGRWKVEMPDHSVLASRKADKWVLPSENEWYKAAYYDPAKPGGAGYWPFAGKGGGAPSCNTGTGAPSDAGTYEDSPSAYGTFDQNGNMWEWNETRRGGKCGVRGGSFYINDRKSYLRSSTRYVTNPPTFEFCNYGFRVAALGGVPGGSEDPSVAEKPSAGPKRTTPKTFYVSRSSGDDSWSGDAPKRNGTRGPWKTLKRASTKYIPGDRILLKRDDTWNDELHPKGNGTPGKPILISSYGEGPKPIIDREDYNRDLVGIHLYNQGGIKIVGIEFARCMTGIYGAYSADCPTQKYIWIEDCYFRDSLKYASYHTYPNPKNIGLGICFFSHETKNRIVLQDIMIKNCVFRRLASGVWTNSPDNFNKNASYIYNFGNLVMEDCLFEEGYQWQQGIRGVAGGAMRNCVTHDIGRGFRSFNGVAGSMFFRAKDWIFEDCEWGFISIGQGSGDGEAFDFEGNCDDMIMRDCLFHDTDGPGFLMCCYASDGHPNTGILMENCVINGKSKRPIGLPRCAIVNTTDWTESVWKNCRFYLSPGEALMKVMDPENDKNTDFVDCRVRNLRQACSTPNLALKARSKASSGTKPSLAVDGKPETGWIASGDGEQWLELRFPSLTTVNEFNIHEDKSSSIDRYVIEYRDPKTDAWRSCFNGRHIKGKFVAPIVSRRMQHVRLRVMSTRNGNPGIAEFAAYNDPGGEVWNDEGGVRARHRVGR